MPTDPADQRSPSRRTATPALGPLRDEPCEAVVVCCVDHRFVQAHREHALRTLGEQPAAWFMVPGGPAALTPKADEALWRSFRFVLEALAPKRALLMAHDRCAYYLQALGATAASLRSRQERDLHEAAQRIVAARPAIVVERALLQVVDGCVAAAPLGCAGEA